MNTIFLEITVVIAIAAAFGMLAKWLKQPTILGYIATGLIVGPLGLMRLDNIEVLEAMAHIGITLLLFLVGMEMRLRELRFVGKPAVLTGIGQVVFTSVIGLFIAKALGYAFVPALYIAVALTFSSTIIVVKLLTEKNALDTLYGKIVVGFLLVQDFVALFALIMLSSLEAGMSIYSLPVMSLLMTFLRGALLFITAMALGKYVIPRILQVVAHSQEVLFLASLAWGMGVAALVTVPQIGFSVEIGGFLAGVSLAGSIEHFQITSKVKSLRDFFIVMFFVTLGSRIILSNISEIWFPTLILSVFVLIGNPLIVMLIMGGLGYKSRTSFLASVTVAQISEFSLILVALGATLGHIDESVVSMVTAVGIITITLSSYMILSGEKLHAKFKRFLKVFEFNPRDLEDTAPAHEMQDHVVLVGAHRMGHSILHSLENLHGEFLVVDFNPDIVKMLLDRGIRTIYGDINDPEIQDKAGLKKARTVISTPHLYEDSLTLLEYMKAVNPKAKVILTAETEYEAVNLYSENADYVMLPHYIGGLQLAKLLQADRSLAMLEEMKGRDLHVIGEQLNII